jgi:hypothetical protein
MEDGHNLDRIRPDAIDDAVIAVDDFTQGFVANLRHDSPR